MKRLQILAYRVLAPWLFVTFLMFGKAYPYLTWEPLVSVRIHHASRWD